MRSCIIAVMLVAATVAEARTGDSIVVVGGDAAFASALDDALLPAGLDVLALGSITAPSLAELPARSRELADREHAAATVWLLPSSTGATLVTYDRSVDRLLVRELTYRLPLSTTQAAEVARMVRTMLRALRVAEEDRPPPPPAVRAPAEPMFAASAGAGAWFASPGAGAALAVYGSVAWRPDSLGAAVGVLAAPDAPVMSATFAGSVRDIVLAAEARRALALPPSIRVTPAAGAALHVLQLHGAFGGGGPLTSRRYDPAVRLGVTATYDLPRGVEAGVAVSVDYLLQRQRFVGASEEILVVPRFQVVIGIVVGLRL